jgi:hypothetical protein
VSNGVNNHVGSQVEADGLKSLFLALMQPAVLAMQVTGLPLLHQRI